MEHKSKFSSALLIAVASLFLPLLFFSSAAPARAGIVPSNINTSTSWSAVNNPYEISGEVAVGSGATLTVGEG